MLYVMYKYTIYIYITIYNESQAIITVLLKLLF